VDGATGLVLVIVVSERLEGLVCVEVSVGDGFGVLVCPDAGEDQVGELMGGSGHGVLRPWLRLPPVSEYPPGTLGFEVDELERKVEALPWGPVRWVWRRRARAVRLNVARRRDESLRRWFAENW